jgi:hypothetical protein
MFIRCGQREGSPIGRLSTSSSLRAGTEKDFETKHSSVFAPPGLPRLLTAQSGMNPDSAVEREVMSKEQTFRSEDNAFCL